MAKRSVPHTLLLALFFLLLLGGVPYIIAVYGGIENLATKIGIGVYVFLIVYIFFLTLSGSAVVDLFGFGRPDIAWSFFKHRMVFFKDGDALIDGLNADLGMSSVQEFGFILDEQKNELRYLPGLDKFRRISPTFGKLKRKITSTGTNAVRQL